MGARLAESASDSAPEEACLFLFDVIILRSFFWTRVRFSC